MTIQTADLKQEDKIESEELVSTTNKIKQPYWKFGKGKKTKIKKLSDMTDKELNIAKHHANKEANYHYKMVEFFCTKEDQINEEIAKRNES